MSQSYAIYCFSKRSLICADGQILMALVKPVKDFMPILRDLDQAGPRASAIVMRAFLDNWLSIYRRGQIKHRRMDFLGGVFLVPMLVDGDRHFGKPRTILDQFQNIRSGEKLYGVGRRIAKRFEQPR